MRFIPNTPPIRQAMLSEMGLARIEDLFDSLPKEVLLGRGLNIPAGMAEPDQLVLFEQLAGKNKGARLCSFLGAGAYPHFIPLVINALIQRGEFLTSYTPYQPEISQGTLQAIFEYQSFITTLTGMEVANASVYDGASAAAEAVLMACRLKNKRGQVLIADTLQPQYRTVIETYCRYLPIQLQGMKEHPETGQVDLPALRSRLNDDVAAVLVQQPNYLGAIEELQALAEEVHRSGALLIVCVTEALSLPLLKAPGACGVDLVAGEAQSFGIPLAFGGPYLGFMAARDAHKRQLPGRIAGETVDTEGRRGFVLTMATREQHIRREKATSNICTNQNLMMLAALIHLTLLGRIGLREAAGANLSLFDYLNRQICALPGFSRGYAAPSFNEAVFNCPKPAREIVAACIQRGIHPGLDLGRDDLRKSHALLIAVTETKTRDDIDALVDALREAAQ